jgi:hypothetical protein
VRLARNLTKYRYGRYACGNGPQGNRGTLPAHVTANGLRKRVDCAVDGDVEIDRSNVGAEMPSSEYRGDDLTVFAVAAPRTIDRR